jgi:hypothetical protein
VDNWTAEASTVPYERVCSYFISECTFTEIGSRREGAINYSKDKQYYNIQQWERFEMVKEVGAECFDLLS